MKSLCIYGSKMEGVYFFVRDSYQPGFGIWINWSVYRDYGTISLTLIRWTIGMDWGMPF